MHLFLRNAFVSKVNNNMTIYDVLYLTIAVFYLNAVSLPSLSLLRILVYNAMRFEGTEQVEKSVGRSGGGLL
jgi:hypothetical protein